jgi:isoaspartyl peptidase/L-asparaginase-like protein (Ntn-hydrolase superfamily)
VRRLASSLSSGHNSRVREGESERSGTTVRLTAGQLVTIANALDEVCNGIRELEDDDEFVARIGATRDEVRQLLAEFHGLTEGPETFPR